MFSLLLIPILSPHGAGPVDSILTDTERLSVIGMGQPWVFLAPNTTDPFATVQGQRMLLGLFAFDPDSAPPPETSSLTGATSSEPVLTATINTHPMSNKLTVGSTNTVALKGLKNTETRLYLDDATVELTALLDATDTPVTGTQNIAMPYISGVGHSVLYRGAIPHTVPLVGGATYTRRITATDVDGNVRVFDKEIVAEAG